MGDKVVNQNVEIMPFEESDAEEKGASPSFSDQQVDTQGADQLGENTPFHYQDALLSPQLSAESSTTTAHHLYGQPSTNAQPYPYNMAVMAGALHDYGQAIPSSYTQQSAPRPVAGASTPAIVYQMQQNMQFSQQAASFGASTPYGAYGQSPYPSQYTQSPGGIPHGKYGSPYASGSHRATGIPPTQYTQNPPVQYYYYPDPYGHQAGSSSTYSPQGAPFTNFPRSNAPSDVSGQMADPTARRLPGGYGMSYHGTSPPVDETTMRSESATSAIPRGPPRKPKQSGHALWVGNLPPQASIIALKDHFSRDARREIDSLFLISKSNCAFVNYRTEQACEKAVSRFHDSRFQGVRLVCRLRKSSTAATGVPSGPASMSGGKAPALTSARSTDDEHDDEEEEDEQDEQEIAGNILEETISTQIKSSERYFIVKSLTLQDLEQSVRNGIWATQSHNEDVLNKAYRSAENVYLIFSANKSGEYFGYARMASPILENAAEIYGNVPRTDVSETIDSPKTIPTPATESAPKGHIIDDSARGTIFWEAEHSDDEAEVEDVSETSDGIDTEPQSWGKPFRVEWISTNRLPFYRARGLRNPWNANREVKIARDGTELEPNVGSKLVQLFHRLGSVSTASTHSHGGYN